MGKTQTPGCRKRAKINNPELQVSKSPPEKQAEPDTTRQLRSLLSQDYLFNNANYELVAQDCDDGRNRSRRSTTTITVCHGATYVGVATIYFDEPELSNLDPNNPEPVSGLEIVLSRKSCGVTKNEIVYSEDGVAMSAQQQAIIDDIAADLPDAVATARRASMAIAGGKLAVAG